MNTFLPCRDFAKCARVLDPDRLSRQISEVCVIAKALWAYGELLRICDREMPWGFQFPSVLSLWTTLDGTVLLPELRAYHKAIHKEWLRHHDNRPHKSFHDFNWSVYSGVLTRRIEWPEELHESHRSKLVSKDASYYRRALERCGLPSPKTGLSYAWLHPKVLPCEVCGLAYEDHVCADLGGGER